MIGLIDLDLQTTKSINLCPPNLEIMKLATYYRTEENLFCNLISLKDNIIEGYDVIYCFSEQFDPIIPDIVKRQSNIIYGGTGFTNGEYIPFQNSIIDFTLPKTWIYKNFLKEKYDEGIKTNIINQLLDNTYYRRYAGEEKLPMPSIKSNKLLYLYDTDFFSYDWEDTIQEAIDRKVRGIHSTHPIVCKTLSQYFKLRTYPKITRSNDILLDTEVPLDEVSYMLKKYQNMFLADITKNTAVYIPIGGTFQTNLQYYKDLIYKLNLLYSFWAYNIPIKLKYMPPKIGTTTSIINLLKLIAGWSHLTNPASSINDRLMRKMAVIEEKKILLKFHPSAADLFTQTYNDLSRRGVWRV